MTKKIDVHDCSLFKTWKRQKNKYEGEPQRQKCDDKSKMIHITNQYQQKNPEVNNTIIKVVCLRERNPLNHRAIHVIKQQRQERF